MTNRNPRIDEISNPQFIRLLLMGLAFQCLCSVVIGLSWDTLSATLQTLVPVALGAGLVGYLAVLLRLLFCRVRIDENGVHANGLTSGYRTLRWTDIRTAAIFRLMQDGKPGNAVILLTTRPPEESLTREALTTSKVLAPHEHLRIPLGYDRRKAIEHYLHMTLPEYRL